MHPSKQRTWLNVAMAVVAPLVLAVLELFHPHPTDLLVLDVRPWLVVHYAQIPLFAMSALAVTTLLRDHEGVAATVARIALFIYAVSFVAFDTVAGVAVGILVDAAQASPHPEAWRDAIYTLWRHSVMGGVRLNEEPQLATLGRVALATGTIAAAVSLKRSGSPWIPVGLLALSSLGINLLHSHSWPGGPLTFGTIALAAGWIQYEAATRAARARRTATASARRPDDFMDAPTGAHVRGESTPPIDPTIDRD